MAAASPSALASSVEKINGAKLSRLLIDGGTTVLRNVFDRCHSPANLAADLNANYLTLNNLYKKKVLHQSQWDKLFPPGGATPDSKTFDITLLFLLLTNICGLYPPLSGWHKPPPSSDTSIEANLARVKLYRNELYGHVTSTGVQTALFNVKWQEISAVLVALGLNPTEVAKLKSAPCGDDYVSAVIEWVKSDEEIKSQLREVLEIQQEARQLQQKDHRTLQDTHKAVEGVQQIQQDTHRVVEEVLKTQQEEHQKQQEARQIQEEDHRTLQDTYKAVEGVRQIHLDTHILVEKVLETHQDAHSTQQQVCQTQQEVRQTQQEVRQTQQEVRQTQQDVRLIQQCVSQKQQEAHEAIQEVVNTQNENRETLKQVKKKVENLTDGNYKENNEVLSKLAKINTDKVIEYHAGRYQEGTRVSFFGRVENWLDDRSCVNRLMVISGNAGMGKSVISAVVCKRMQEAGRLSGSHFCQHDKARHRNAKIMLQSLASQLSDFLPEYKHILVKTLSRNLGEELNHMEVKDLFEVLFEEPLSRLKDPGRNFLMVIDGIDESEYQGRNDLLDVIANHFTKLPCWIRFLVTTRPEISITDSLKSFNPLQLKPNNEENLMDLRLLFEKRLSDVIEQDQKEVVINELVQESEGLILYAFLLVNFIKENVSLLTLEQLDSALPSGISSIYQSYFQRLETELCKELKIKEEQFLTFLSALTAAREPLLLDFVTKIMLSGTSSLTERRKMKKVIACISALLPVRDDCIHFFHKSVRDWLTDTSLYGQHDFTVDEKEGHRVLSEICTDELDDIKQKVVGNAEFTNTATYALQHGVRHILESKEEAAATFSHEEVVWKYVVDLEIVYAKLLVNSTVASEDIVIVQKQWGWKDLIEESEGNILLFLLRKHRELLKKLPRTVFQTVLNEGGPLLSSSASHLLETKYSELTFMEYLHKRDLQRDLQATFTCSSEVACFDVSPHFDYMVCECGNETIQLWSLLTGKLLWVRPVMIVKQKVFTKEAVHGRVHRQVVFTSDVSSPSSSVLSFYRSVVFHPTKNVVLPGVLRKAYTTDGDIKPLFPESKCSFTVCSISRDKNMMLTNCPDNANCIILWDLNSGDEIDRISRKEDVLSFAWSRDGELLAVSHSSGSICLFDVNGGFRILAETATSKACGIIKFSSDQQFLYCLHLPLEEVDDCLYRLNVSVDDRHTYSLNVSSDVVSPFEPCNFQSPCKEGFVLGDQFSYFYERITPAQQAGWGFGFVLSKYSVLMSSPHVRSISMLDPNELIKVRKARRTRISNIEISLDGGTVYAVNSSIETELVAWDVASGKLKAKKSTGFTLQTCVLAVKGGVLFTGTGATVELWNCELSECVQSWTNLPRIAQIIPISGELVACIEELDYKNVPFETYTTTFELWNLNFFGSVRSLTNLPITTHTISISEERVEGKGRGVVVIILDTSSREIVSTVRISKGTFVACSSKCQLLTTSGSSVYVSDGTVITSKKVFNCSFELRYRMPLPVLFSATGQFVVVNAETFNPKSQSTSVSAPALHVLDAVSGKMLHSLCEGERFHPVTDVKFISDEECAVSSRIVLIGLCVRLFNIRSGDLLSVINTENRVLCLASCPRSVFSPLAKNHRHPISK